MSRCRSPEEWNEKASSARILVSNYSNDTILSKNPWHP